MKVLTGSFQAAILAVGLVAAVAQPVGRAVAAANNGIAWDATVKSLDAASGQDSAAFVFAFTNVAFRDNSVLITNYTWATNFVIYRNTSFWKIASGDKYTSVPQLVTNMEVTTVGSGVTPIPVTILSVQPSSGCKTADLPSQPWVISPGVTGEIRASVDLAGQSGTVERKVAVNTDHGRIDLTLRVNVAAAAPSTQAAAEPGGAQSLRASWAFDQSSGNEVADTTGNGNTARLAEDSGIWSKSGPTGSGALSLNGSNFAEVAIPVVDTAQGFTAAAWVNIAAMDKRYNQTVVSIDGDQVSGFFLMLNAMKSPARFSFTRYPGDRGSSARAMAEGSPNPALNTWYHVAGVYDADAQTISLYVNGKKQSTVPCSGSWQAKGKTAIGRGFFGHKKCDYLNGMISDVRLYASALSAEQIQALAVK